MKCVAVGGVPATGKTTLMRKVINILQPKQELSYGLVRGMLIEDIAILGVYKDNEIFAGTDKLSMAVQKHFDQYVAKKHKHLIFEGDRLFTKNNLLNLTETHDCKIIVLKSDEKTLHQRHIDRNDTQNDRFLKSRETKIRNICDEPELQNYIEYFSLKDHQQSEELAKEIIDFIS
tara:strand:- start:73 stop:597 length:525 start_codon:yes stop_codon:yes gene_type:complete